MLSKFFLLLLSSLFTFNNVSNPMAINLNATPELSAKSAISFDLETQTISFQKNIHQKLPIASLTKLMTLYIIMSESNLDQEVLITQKHLNIPGSKADLKPNTTYSILELLQASLLNSSNQAAMALAEFNSGSEEKFVEKMNQYAKSLKLTNTSFANPIGFDHKNNYSTAYDLTKLTLAISKFHTIINTANKNKLTITNNKNQKTILKNTNHELQNALSLNGLKTGTTPDAGQCFIGLTAGPNKLITIVLDSKNRFLDTNNLIEYNSNFIYNDIISSL